MAHTDLSLTDERITWLQRQPREVANVMAARAALRVIPAISLASGSTGTRFTRRETIVRTFHACAAAWATTAYRGEQRLISEIARRSVRGLSNLTIQPPFRAAAYAAATAGNPEMKSSVAAASTAMQYALDAAAQCSGKRGFQTILNAMMVDAESLSGKSLVQLPQSGILDQDSRFLAGKIYQGGFDPVTVAHQQLWPTPMPDWVEEHWIALADTLNREDEDWEVWTEWYYDRLTGRQTSQQEEIARLQLVDGRYESTLDEINYSLRKLREERAYANYSLQRLTGERNQTQARRGTNEIDDPEPLLPTIPGQTLAPIRVEERDGKVAKVSDRDGPISGDPADLVAWCKPVARHIGELLEDEFRQGTNHGVVRATLLHLHQLVSADIGLLSEQQFDLGYSVIKLEHVLIAYRSADDDMPSMNRGSLEQLSGLAIALRIGTAKLERWSLFMRLAENDPRNDGSADPGIVSNAIVEIAEYMEAEPKYFSEELPTSLRFMSEALRDPKGAGKAAVYGAVRSVENVFGFVAEMALGTAKKTSEKIQKHISTAAAIAILAALAGPAATISGALPTAWEWLAPLLRFFRIG